VRSAFHLVARSGLLGDAPGDGASALREMLGLYADVNDPSAQRQIEETVRLIKHHLP